MTLELLESRIAPAALTFASSGKTVTWTDVDGDAVTLTITAGTLTEANFVHEDAGVGLVVKSLDLTGTQFAHTSLALVAKRVVSANSSSGNGFVDLGYLNATGNALKAISIDGDLGRIDAGPATLTPAASQALTSLKVASLGARPDLSGSALLESNLHGRVGPVVVTGELLGALHVTGDSLGTISALTIGYLAGGDIAGSGQVTTTGDVGTIVINGDVQGGAGQQSGRLEVGGNLKSLRLVGSIVGGRSANTTSEGTGVVRVEGNLQQASLTGSIFGGTQQGSGLLDVGGTVGSLTLGSIYGGTAGNENGGVEAGALGKVVLRGDVRGGAAEHSGYISTESLGTLQANAIVGGTAADAGQLIVDGPSQQITLRGNILGGTAAGAGVVNLGSVGRFSAQDVVGGAAGTGSVTVTGAVAVMQLGSLLGGPASQSGLLNLGSVGSLTLAGDLVGGNLDSAATAGTAQSGSIMADHITSLRISGAVRTGADSSTAFDLSDNGSIRVKFDLRSLTVTQGLFGNDETRVLITAAGEQFPVVNSFRDLAIGSAFFGTVSHADVLAGYNQSTSLTTAAINPDAQIGLVKVAGSWVASNLVAGAAYNSAFGSGTDTKAGGPDQFSTFSRIGGIVIGGSIQGTSTAGDHYGFVAQGIGYLVYGPGALQAARGVPPLLALKSGVDNTKLNAAPGSFPADFVLLNRSVANDNDPVDLRYGLSNTNDVRIFETAL